MMENATNMTAVTIGANYSADYSFLKLVPSSHMDIISGYVSTAVVLFTVVTNYIVCVVLLKPHMRTSPTNIILVALSITTTLTGVWPLPCNVYFYVLGGYSEWVPAGWCFVYECLIDYLPTIFHTASIWLPWVRSTRTVLDLDDKKIVALAFWPCLWRRRGLALSSALETLALNTSLVQSHGIDLVDRVAGGPALRQRLSLGHGSCT